MTTRKLIPPVVLGMTVCILAGCGESGPDLYEAAGTLTMDGAPVEGATVTFIAEGVGQIGGSGRTDAEGKFTILATSGKQGIAPGSYKITVRKVEGEGFDGGPGATKEQKQKAMMDMMVGKPKKLIYVVPAKYSDATKTPLTAVVSDDPEKNQFPLDVKP